MATAVAGHFLGINPFDQPNVESAKVKAREMVAEYGDKGVLPAGDFSVLDPAAVKAFLQHAKPGDYVSIHAYVPPTPAMDMAMRVTPPPISMMH